MPIRNCVVCSSEFFIHQWRLNSTKTKRGQYCSVTCRIKGQVGDNAAHWQNRQSEMDCTICGKHFTYKLREDRDRRFCTPKCKYMWMHLEIVGSRHHNYTNGKAALSGEKHLTYEYRQWKKQVEALEDSCRKCGSKNRLETDHILTILIHPEEAYNVANGQVLCYDCHRLKTLDDIQDMTAYRRKRKLELHG